MSPALSTASRSAAPRIAAAPTSVQIMISCVVTLPTAVPVRSEASCAPGVRARVATALCWK